MYCTTCSYGTVSWELCLSVIFCSLKYNNWKWKLNWGKEGAVIVPEELWYNLLSPALFTLRVFFYHQTSTNDVFTFYNSITPDDWLSPALFTLRVFSFTTKQVLMMSLHSCNSIAPDDWLSPALFTLRVFSLNSCNSIKKSVIAPEELWNNLLSPALFTLRVFFYHQTSTNDVFTFYNSITPDDWLSPALFTLRVFSFTTKQVLMMSLHPCNSIAPDDGLARHYLLLECFLYIHAIQ